MLTPIVDRTLVPLWPHLGVSKYSLDPTASFFLLTLSHQLLVFPCLFLLSMPFDSFVDNLTARLRKYRPRRSDEYFSGGDKILSVKDGKFLLHCDRVLLG
jgi:hypothetical protein